MTDTLFYSPEINFNPQLPEIESYHCVKVLRMKSGDKLTVTDGKGYFYNCTLLDANPKYSTVSILNRVRAFKKWNFNLQLAFSPTKQMDRNEWFIEKATELGVDKFIPVISSYSERKEIKTERLKKTAISAMKQSLKSYLPEIDEPIKFHDFISIPFDGKKFIAHCHDLPKKPLVQSYIKGQNALIIIGPEGDFSKEEVNEASKYGFIPISLGESRLRTETAALVASHSIHVLNNI